MDRDMVEQVVEVARRVVASGAISANAHGNVSLRVAGEDEMYFTGGSSLRDHPAEAVTRVGLDGVLGEGQLPPIQSAVVAMHSGMYADRADVGWLIHTHSPYAWLTALRISRSAAGSRPWPCSACQTVPVASHGRRGSEQAVANIRAAVVQRVPAVLFADPGVLVFHRTPDLAIMVGGVVEEAAQAGINAIGLGGAVPIPPEMKAAALQRAVAFEHRGTTSA